ncbi:MAG: site-specific DNA-methyltransferase [Methylovulum sp.]|uniref:site-specific DNA-methyltransferase n=1 Tax=Methylovulum sp. TaxID=1916980 RepID=UPI00262C7F1E|nr:site-specific DNA-methyltransferase [Methylovulum sp.]MDD2722905.1 site-specific DNA-methyltransferase [Methylovulum sp.]
MSKTKLELTWIGKDKRPKLEPRILLENPELSYHAKFRRYSPSPPAPLPEGEGSKMTAEHLTVQSVEAESPKSPSPSWRGVGERVDLFDNKLIFGDNLLALKALEQNYAGKVKCVFIDPPYNTGSAFTHYDDGLEHSIWLSLMRDRLEIIRSLLSDDGSLWITIDDNEAHYLKVLCDEVFGRGNFVANVVWEKKYAPQNNATWLSDSHDHILVFTKNKELWRPLKLSRSDEMDARYTNRDNDPRGIWKASDFTISLSGGQRGAQFAKTGVSSNIYEIVTPSGRCLMPAKGRCWAASPEKYQELLNDNRLWFGENGNNVPALKRFLTEVQNGIVAKTIWFRTEVGDNQEAKKEALVFNGEEVFSTPKPEKLLKRILELATNPNDLVLDSFAGSGTTGAVAHKMGRRWIMIELGEHCHTHIIPRLKKVIAGEDPGGISKAVNWQGGGGFRYYSLAPSLLEQDRWGNWVVNKNYNPAMLAEALCKLEGFSYAPSDTQWWNHGYSSEQDFIYVTTQNLSHQQLQELSEEVGGDRSLLVCCAAFRGKTDAFPNLTLKKIPKMVLSRCEWAHDDYSLNVANLPMAQPKPEAEKPKKASVKLVNIAQDDLFGEA